MSGASDQEDSRLTHEIAHRAIRRLDVLEWVMLAGAAGMAIVGGALVAWVLDGVVAWSFRTLWMVTALFLFAVPGAIVFTQLRREEARSRARLEREPDEDHG